MAFATIIIASAIIELPWGDLAGFGACLRPPVFSTPSSLRTFRQLLRENAMLIDTRMTLEDGRRL